MTTMKTDIHQPCNECPFRRVHPPGWLGPWEVEDLLQQLSLGTFPCHQTIRMEEDVDEELIDVGAAGWNDDVLQGCAGAAILLNNKLEISRHPETRALQDLLENVPDDVKASVFQNSSEFRAHHLPYEEAQKQRDRVNTAIRQVARDNDVRILFAVESGSRAWGFPSPDSDYDVRFVYCRGSEGYLRLDRIQDVIECPIESDLDVNGWDLNKALELMLKGNPTFNEWLRSPIRYLWGSWADSIADMALRCHNPTASRYHYLVLCESTARKYVTNRDVVRSKKYLYMVRPSLALRWLRIHGTVPPMDVPSIRRGVDLEPDLEREIDRLIAQKGISSEMAEVQHVRVLDEFIQSECDMARAEAPKKARLLDPVMLPEANDLFRRIVNSTTERENRRRAE